MGINICFNFFNSMQIFDPCEAGENQCYEYQTWPAQGTLDCMVDQAVRKYSENLYNCIAIYRVVQMLITNFYKGKSP